MDLSGRVSLVTGAARRVGRAIALGLARRGSRLAIHYRKSRDEAAEVTERIRQDGGEAHPFQADLRQGESCTRLVDDVVSHFGGIDVLVNSASTFERTPLGEVTDGAWDDLLSVNLKASFFCSQAAGLRMKGRGGGKIINVADVAALRPWIDYVPYSVAKAGVVALTRALSRALAPEVQVNAVAPGTILPREGTPAEEVERWGQETLLGRIGTPQEMVGAVLFLLEGGDFITGEVILLDGGRHLA